jgi:hypothetical protein
MQVIRVLGKLEPGGAQLALLRLSRELERRHGVRTRLLVGDATHDGLRLAQRHGTQTVAFRTVRRSTRCEICSGSNRDGSRPG